jgi:hypothetical protein
MPGSASGKVFLSKIAFVRLVVVQFVKISKLVIPRPGLSAEESAFSQQQHSIFPAR